MRTMDPWALIVMLLCNILWYHGNPEQGAAEKEMLFSFKGDILKQTNTQPLFEFKVMSNSKTQT